MKEYLTYEEKCILLASINHERKYADNLIRGDKLLQTCDQLEHKFMYDRLFKQIRSDAFDEVERAMYHEAFEVSHEKDGMQKWDSGNWIRYKLFENVIEQLKEKK